MLTVYKASAGSGKTYTLALTYISTLLGIKTTDKDGTAKYVLNSAARAPGGRRYVNRHRCILAITFTNKATAEMKERIIMQLNRLARVPSGGGDDSPYARELTARFACSRGELADAAALALKELLCDYSQFNVSTIDSFFQTVLRTFARDVNHQGDYAVELDEADAVEAGIGLMLDEINFGKHPEARNMKRWIDTLTAKKITEGQRFNVFESGSKVRSQLRDFVKTMCGEQFRRRAGEMEEYLSSGKLPKLSARVAREIDRTIPEAARQLAARFGQETAGEEGFLEFTKYNFRALLAKLAGGEAPDAKQAGTDAPAAFRAILDWKAGDEMKPLFNVTKLPKAGKEPVYPSPGFVEKCSALAADAAALHVRSRLTADLLAACYNLEFLGFASEFINIYRKDNNLILLSDTNELLKRIIKDEEMPFIYERMGLELTNFMIDEFQDTSRMQWDILKPLISNSLASDNDSLIIGDVKQAIYRFRNSDSSMLAHDVENVDYPDKHTTRGLRPEENTNYRSAHDIVRFNNSLFTVLADIDATPGYESVRQALPDSTAGKQGYVRMDFRTAGDGEEAAYRALVRDILRQHASGYAWRDIAVLVDKRRTGMEIVNYLMANAPEIPVISDEALLLDRSTAVQLIISMLRIIDEAYAFTGLPPEELENRKYATRREISRMTSRFNFYLGEGNPPAEALRKAVADDPAEAKRIHEDVDSVLRLHPTNPVALVETIIAARLGESIRKSEYVFIAAFHDVMENFFSVHEGGIKAFLEWWDAHKSTLSLASAPEIDAVAVLTIHKSKGLEWPCVHIPVCSWKMSLPDPDIWFDVRPLLGRWLPDCTELAPPVLLMSASAAYGLPDSPLRPQYEKDLAEQTADRMNMTYVAFTRASNELIVSCHGSESKGKVSFRGVGNDIFRAFGESPRFAPGADGLTVPLVLGPHGEENGDGGDDAPAYVFTLGAPTSGTGKKETAPPALDSTAYRVVLRQDARELTAVEDAATEALVNIGGEEDKETVDTPEQYSDERMRAAAERGTNIHNVLSTMRRFEDMAKSISAVGNLADISPEGRREIAAILENAFRAGGARVAAWFGDNIDVLAEREIFDPRTGEIHRPDRVIVFPDGHLEIIDYKFTTEVRPSHRRQVERYRRLLAEIYPGRTILGFLWYPERCEIMEV